MKFLAGILLLPLCWAATRTLAFFVAALLPETPGALPLSAWGMLIGFVFWVLLFICMPRPILSYVLAHELTHALWGLLMGARIKKLKVSSKGGSTTLSKSNFLITLAPYFFPLYTILAIAAYYTLTLFFDLRTYEPFWLGVVGLTWGFHLTFTITTLMQRQPDIQENGRLFSYSLIYLLNVLGISLWIALVASPSLKSLSIRFGEDVEHVYSSCLGACRSIHGLIAEQIQSPPVEP